MILIVGGTGALGSQVSRRLLAQRERVRIMTRTPGRAEALHAAGAEVLRGDLLDRDAVIRACTGAEAVVAAAHSLFGRGAHASARVDGDAHRRLIDVARAAGVRHVVYTSVYDYGPEYQAVPFFRIKLEVERHLKASGLGFTILRPTAFMESHAHMLIGEPILAGRRVMLIGRGEQPRNFVAAGDVAAVAVQALQDPALAGETLDVAGPENLTNMDVVRTYERVSGKAARIARLPRGVARTLSTLIRPLHPGIAQVLQLAVLGDTTDQRADGRRVMARFGIEAATLEAWVHRRLQGSDAAHAAS